MSLPWPDLTPEEWRAPAKKGLKYSAEQPRDPHGRWTAGTFSNANEAEATIAHAMGKDQFDDEGDPVVHVEAHPDALRAAAVTATVMEEMRAKGYTMPETITVARNGIEPAGTTEYPTLLGFQIGPPHILIDVPAHLPANTNLDHLVSTVFGGKTIEGYDKYVPRTMRDIVVHEMGHVQAGHRGMNRSFPDGDGVDGNIAAYHVSDYAHENTNEFLAEAFLKQYNGGTLAPDSLKLYQLLKGPEIKR